MACAGVSIDDPYTPAELFVLARARDEAMWWHTATVQATMLNIMGGKQTARDLHPHYAKPKKKQTLSHDRVYEMLKRRQANGSNEGQ